MKLEQENSRVENFRDEMTTGKKDLSADLWDDMRNAIIKKKEGVGATVEGEGLVYDPNKKQRDGGLKPDNEKEGGYNKKEEQDALPKKMDSTAQLKKEEAEAIQRKKEEDVLIGQKKDDAAAAIKKKESLLGGKNESNNAHELVFDNSIYDALTAVGQ